MSLLWGICQLAQWNDDGGQVVGRQQSPCFGASIRWPELRPHPKPHHLCFQWPISGIFSARRVFMPRRLQHCWMRPKVHQRTRCSRLCTHTWILDSVKQHNAIQWEQTWAACQMQLRRKVNDAPKPSPIHYVVIWCKRALTPPKDDIIVFALSSQRKANQSDDRLLPQGSWDIFNDLRLSSILAQPLLDLWWQVRTGPAAPPWCIMLWGHVFSHFLDSFTYSLRASTEGVKVIRKWCGRIQLCH